MNKKIWIPQRERQFRESGHRWEDNTKMTPNKELVFSDVGWVILAQERI